LKVKSKKAWNEEDFGVARYYDNEITRIKSHSPKEEL